MNENKWKIEGYDTFANEPYPIPGEYNSQGEAHAAASAMAANIEASQPSSSSGGQAAEGIQDRIYIVRPDGEKYRYLGNLDDVDSDNEVGGDEE